MKKLVITILLILCLMLTSGCSYMNIQRTVTMPDGEEYLVDARKEDLVTFKQTETETTITVDGRGKSSMFETIMTLMFMKTDFNVSNKEGR